MTQHIINIYFLLFYFIMDTKKLIKKYNIVNFNWIKYVEQYKLDQKGIKNVRNAYKYFINTGFNLGHKWYGINKKKNIIKKNLSYKDFYKKNFDLININNIDNSIVEKKINILIRHTYRPKQFKKCIDSVLNQNYKNYNIIVSYDDDRCLEELSKYNNIDYFNVKVRCAHKYKFNLYCNELMNKVKDGWIMFLDDDDMLSNKNCLKKINMSLSDDNDIVFWKFLRPDRIIFPKNIKQILCGHIVSCGYCFHSKFKDTSKWNPRRSGDYYFLEKLLKNNFNRKFIDNILTCTVYNDRKQNFGSKEAMTN